MNKIEIHTIEYLKMKFIMNALDNGWKVKKNKKHYIFQKPHENKKEIFMDEYLTKFILENKELPNF